MRFRRIKEIVSVVDNRSLIEIQMRHQSVFVINNYIQIGSVYRLLFFYSNCIHQLNIEAIINTHRKLMNVQKDLL